MEQPTPRRGAATQTGGRLGGWKPPPLLPGEEFGEPGEGGAGEADEEEAVAPDEVAVFFEVKDGAELVDVVDHGLDGGAVVAEQFHHGGGELAFGELGVGAEEKDVELVGAAGLGVAAGEDGESGEKGGAEGEGGEDEEGGGERFGIGTAEDDGEDDEGGGDEDACLLVGHAAELDVMLLDGAEQLDAFVGEGRLNRVLHGSARLSRNRARRKSLGRIFWGDEERRKRPDSLQK